VFEPGGISKSTGCVDEDDGINAVKVDYGWDISDRINCIQGYKDDDCKELAFTFPWESDVKGQLLIFAFKMIADFRQETALTISPVLSFPLR
jgi:hypothetical protein